MTTSKPVPAIDHYDNGKVRFRGANLDGKMHRPWKFFRHDGSIMRSGLVRAREADRPLANLRPDRQGPKG